MLLNNCYFLYLFKLFEEDNLKSDNDFFLYRNYFDLLTRSNHSLSAKYIKCFLLASSESFRGQDVSKKHLATIERERSNYT